jgi:hypothetical protein
MNRYVHKLLFGHFATSVVEKLNEMNEPDPKNFNYSLNAIPIGSPFRCGDQWALLISYYDNTNNTQ